MAGASSPDLDITQDGNKFHLKLHSLVQTKETAFTVDEEFEETQQNGAVMKVFVLCTRCIEVCHETEDDESKHMAEDFPLRV